MASSRVESLISQNQTLIEAVESLQRNITTMGVPQKGEALQNMSQKLTSIDNNLKELTKLTRSLAEDERDYFDDEIQTQKDSYATLSEKYRQFNDSYQREQLTAPADQGKTVTAEGNAQLAQANEKLAQAISDGNETLVIQGQIKETLIDDHQRLERIEANVNDINDEAITGFQRASRMLRRACLNKVIAYIIVVVLFAVFLTITIERFLPGAGLYCAKQSKDSSNYQKHCKK